MRGNMLTSCLLVGVIVVSTSLAKPVRRGPPPPKPVGENSPEDPGNTGLAYDSYLRQVVEVLETDPEFRKKLETANVSDIKSGKIAMYLDMVNHTVRTSLDEIKRREIARLQELARLQAQSMAAGEHGLKRFEMPGHLDLRNQHSFEIKDLHALIQKTTNDLEELDKQRREEFKEYEMEKEYTKRHHMEELSEEERKKEEERLEALKKKHADHPKIHHPGSKDQMEEVWDKVDHLEDQEFNPKTFFFKHDVNGDMEWSIEEVDAVLQLELDKVYDARNSPEEDDLVERQEEMNRMREHVFQEMDKDKNKRISFQEFIDYTGKDGENDEFQKDDGWKTVDEEDVFTDDDYMQYVQSHHAQPGEVNSPPDLAFHPEMPSIPPGQQGMPHLQEGQAVHHMDQGQQNFQQQQLLQQQQMMQEQQQHHQQQQQFHEAQQQQQQFQQHPPQQQQFQQHPPQQQQFQQHPPQQQQFQQHPPQQQQDLNQQKVHEQPQLNQGNLKPSADQQQLQQQLKDLQEKLNQQQQQQPEGNQAVKQP